MPRGQSDYGVFAATKTIGGLSDIGELAARLDSPDVFDRRGNVVFLDSFENDLVPYYSEAGGLGGAVEVVASHSKTGLFSAQLTCGSTLTHSAYLYKYLAYPALSKWGFEVTFTYNAAVEDYYFVLVLVNGSDLYQCRIHYNTTLDTLYYQAVGLADVAIAAGLALTDSVYLFHVFKVVVDFEANEYVRLILDNVEYSLAGIAIPTTLTAPGSLMYTAVQLIENLDANPSVYLDEWIITQNEP